MPRGAPPVLQRIAQLRGFARLDECEHCGAEGDLPVLNEQGSVVGRLSIEDAGGVSEEFTKLASRQVERDVRVAALKRLEELEREMLGLCLKEAPAEALQVAHDGLDAEEPPTDGADAALDMAELGSWVEELDRGGRAEATKIIAFWFDRQSVQPTEGLRACIEQLARLREELLRTNLGLVLSLIKSHGFKLEFPFAVMAGCEGLIDAMDRFEPSRNTQFSTYAHWWIRQKLSRTGDDHGEVLRLPIHAQDARDSFVKAERSAWSARGRRPDAEGLIASQKLSARPANLAEWRRTSQTAYVGRPYGEEGTAERFIDADVPSPLDGGLTDAYVERLEQNVRTLLERAVHDKANGSDERWRRGRHVLCGRLGVGRRKQTLQELGEDQGVTRERIRQIEAKLIQRAAKLFRLAGGVERHDYWNWEFEDE